MAQAQYRRPARGRVAYPVAGSNRSGASSKALETRGLGHVDPEAIAPTLVAAGHFRRSLAEAPDSEARKEARVEVSAQRHGPPHHGETLS